MEIKTVKELREILKYEKSKYFSHKPYNGLRLIDYLVGESYVRIWKYQKLLRKTEYYYSHRKNPFYLAGYCIVGRKKNLLGERLGIYIPEYVFDKGLIIDHYGSITVNGKCRVGKECRLHGNNCIGQKGAERGNEFPTAGDNLDLGFGATIIGTVKLGNNIVVGANSLVLQGSYSDGACLVGSPARDIKLSK